MIKPYQSTSGMKKKHVHATFDQIRGFQKDTSQIDLDFLTRERERDVTLCEWKNSNEHLSD